MPYPKGAAQPAARFLGDRLLASVVPDLVPDPLEGAADQPRHVHLRDPDLLRDLRLRQPLEEAQVEDQPLALVQRPEARREHRAILRHLVLRLLGPERLQRVELALVVLRRLRSTARPCV